MRWPPAFGTLKDIEIINDDYDLMFDFMVNHLSRQSKYFVDFLEKRQPVRNLRICFSLFPSDPENKITPADLDKVYTQTPAAVSGNSAPDGSMETIWSTFDFEQIDVDIDSPKPKSCSGIDFLSRKKPTFIRMDAIAYTTVEIGTSCFF
ncbi:MAG: hypothetical protein R2860_10720 [Desulfobacterales bacterium]